MCLHLQLALHVNNLFSSAGQLQAYADRRSHLLGENAKVAKRLQFWHKTFDYLDLITRHAVNYKWTWSFWIRNNNKVTVTIIVALMQLMLQFELFLTAFSSLYAIQ